MATDIKGNVNVAFEQGGDTLILGAQTISGTRTDYRGLQFSTSAGYGAFAYDTDFLGDTVDATLALNGTGSVGISSPTAFGGLATIATTATNNEFETIALGLNFKAELGGLYAEVSFANLSAITLRAVEFGFSDALSETNGLAFSSHDATPVAVATDAVVFGYNTADSMTSWSCLSVKNGGTPQVSVLGSTYAPVAGTYQRLGVAVDATGNAQFTINGIVVATFANAITPTVGLTFWLTLKSLSAAIKSASIDYISAVCNRV